MRRAKTDPRVRALQDALRDARDDGQLAAFFLRAEALLEESLERGEHSVALAAALLCARARGLLEAIPGALWPVLVREGLCSAHDAWELVRRSSDFAHRIQSALALRLARIPAESEQLAWLEEVPLEHRPLALAELLGTEALLRTAEHQRTRPSLSGQAHARLYLALWGPSELRRARLEELALFLRAHPQLELWNLLGALLPREAAALAEELRALGAPQELPLEGLSDARCLARQQALLPSPELLSQRALREALDEAPPGFSELAWLFLHAAEHLQPLLLRETERCAARWFLDAYDGGKGLAALPSEARAHALRGLAARVGDEAELLHRMRGSEDALADAMTPAQRREALRAFLARREVCLPEETLDALALLRRSVAPALRARVDALALDVVRSAPRWHDLSLLRCLRLFPNVACEETLRLTLALPAQDTRADALEAHVPGAPARLLPRLWRAAQELPSGGRGLLLALALLRREGREATEEALGALLPGALRELAKQPPPGSARLREALRRRVPRAALERALLALTEQQRAAVVRESAPAVLRPPPDPADEAPRPLRELLDRARDEANIPGALDDLLEALTESSDADELQLREALAVLQRQAPHLSGRLLELALWFRYVDEGFLQRNIEHLVALVPRHWDDSSPLLALLERAPEPLRPVVLSRLAQCELVDRAAPATSEEALRQLLQREDAARAAPWLLRQLPRWGATRTHSDLRPFHRALQRLTPEARLPLARALCRELGRSNLTNALRYLAQLELHALLGLAPRELELALETLFADDTASPRGAHTAEPP